ncbi:MAG: nuclear transport factor 2 family protein [Planctomycetes bacterium]|nr:nuclear transport factor 2 family protein [Planctomycetota bacterium]
MNLLLPAIPLLALVAGIHLQDPAPKPPTDEAQVRQAALDYVEALYEAKPELIERSVHADLVKYGFWREKATSPYEGSAMTKAQLLALTKSWNRKGNKADASSVKKVEVLDVMDQTAVAKVTAVWGIDHMQLAKFDGKWQIRHILWQSHPAEAK